MTNLNLPTDFLLCPTPQQWLEKAKQNIDLLLIDHAHCEKKAAATALNLMFRYVDRDELLQMLSRLAREELRHFEQVHSILQQRGIEYCHLTPSRYAQKMRQQVRQPEPHRLTDTLIIGSIIEARSCERFMALAPLLDDELAKYYRFLVKSESRHFQDYLHLAKSYATDNIDVRIEYFLNLEKQLIEAPDDEFRFHSGIPS